MGVIAVETRAVEVVIPADPGNPESDSKVYAQKISISILIPQSWQLVYIQTARLYLSKLYVLVT